MSNSASSNSANMSSVEGMFHQIMSAVQHSVRPMDSSNVENELMMLRPFCYSTLRSLNSGRNPRNSDMPKLISNDNFVIRFVLSSE
jgi:hypothetical protein